LLLDRQKRAAWIAPVEEARAHLQAQWPATDEHPLAGMTEDQAASGAGLEWPLWTEAPGEVSVSPMEVQARMATQHRRMEDLARWLDLMTNSRPG